MTTLPPTSCTECPLRQLPLFTPHTPQELALVHSNQAS